MRVFRALPSFSAAFTAALLLFSAPSPAQPAPGQPLAARHVAISLIPERTDVQPGETIEIAIDQTIDTGWHTYWINPGDSGQTMTVDWRLPAGFEAGALQWPVPEKITLGPVVNYGYHSHAVLLQEITLPPELPEGPLTLSADISLLVCSDICVPEKGTYSFTLNDGSHRDNSAAIKAAQTWLPEEIDGNAFYKEDGDNIDLAVILDNIGARADFDILPVEWGVVDNGAQADSELIERNEIVIHKKHGERPLGELGPLEMLVTYQSPAPGAFLITAHPDLGAFVQAERAKHAPSRDLGYTLLAALLGGLILNLMPCVFPVLSIKALSLCAIADKEAAQARKSGLAYTTGVLASFALMAAVLLALRAAGEEIGWGFQLQNPVVVLLLADLLFAIGLNLSGLFELTGAFTNVGGRLAAKQGAAGSFFTGILAAVVATPCTAPFMGAALGAALLHPGPEAVAIFLALGFGLALPYLLLSFVPVLRHALPKPGPWMQVLREVLAFPMYASAAWLVWVYTQQTGADGVLYALAGFIGLGFSLWLLRHSHLDGSPRILLRLFAALALVAALLVAFIPASPLNVGSDSPLPVSAQMPDGEIQFTQDTLDGLLAGDRPVLVNMTAAWCITCKANEKIALGTKATRALFRDRNVAYLVGDWTNRNAEITSYLAQFGRNGVPLYVYYAPPLENGRRPQPVILPQLLSESILNDTIGGGTNDDD
jgi:thiol:disulfide interchange protein DsbD